MRPDGAGRLLAGRGYPKDYELVDPDAYDEHVDAAFEADVLARVQKRLPAVNGLRRVDGRVGLYEVTPDWHPILGAVDGYDGLFLATGGSGHCFKLGPAIGELVAGAVLGRDVGDTFALSRFDEGRELRSTYGGNRA
jgi:glycine/D-amino acid oxidase-like deaminating enzyme